MRISSLLLLSVFFIMSCNNDDDTTPMEPEKEGNCLTAKVNGEVFEAETTTGFFNIVQLDDGTGEFYESKMLNILGVKNELLVSSKSISLFFACTEISDELTFEGQEEACGVSVNYNETNLTNPEESIVTIPLSGSIYVESVTEDHIRGTFNFITVDDNGNQYELTEGFFDTEIILQ